MTHTIPRNEGIYHITLKFNEMEYQSIQDAFAMIKKQGSRFEDKESMMKTIVLSKTQLCSVLKSLGDTFGKEQVQKDRGDEERV